MAEKSKVEVFANNIANIHNPQYIAKNVNFEKLLAEVDDALQKTVISDGQLAIDSELISDDRVGKDIALDQEVARITDAELRYQAIAHAIQKKFGLMDLIIGGKSK